MNAQNEVKKVGSTALQFFLGLLGLTLGSFVMPKVPATNIAIVDKLLPGAIGVGLAYLVSKKFSQKWAQAGAFGLGLAGAANILNRFTSAAAPGTIAEKLNKASSLPTLSGVGHSYVQNQGQYAPDYFLERRGTSMNGADQNAYRLEGADASAYALEGLLWNSF